MVGISENAGRNAANSVSGLWAQLFVGSKINGESKQETKPAFSYSKLVQLHTKFSQFSERDFAKENGNGVVETVKDLTEALLWGEKNDSNFFSFFCERSILGDFVRVLGSPGVPKNIKVQLLQTLSMLVQNISSQSSVQHLFDRSNLNELILMPLDFTDDEIIAYYITLLKSLALRLDDQTANFFFFHDASSPSSSGFPLYIEATKFFSNSDQMVRATVRTITLQVYKASAHNPAMRAFVLHHAKESYFSQLVHHLRDLWLNLDDSISACRNALGEAFYKAQNDNVLQQDFLMYLSDVFDLEVPGLKEILSDRLLRLVIVPMLVSGSLLQTDQDSRQRVLSIEVALILLRQLFDTFRSPTLLQPLASLLFQDKVPPAITRLLPKELQSVKVSDFMQKNRCREVFMSLLSSPDEQVFLLSAAIVHACARNRKALPVSFLRSANIFLPGAKEEKPKNGHSIFTMLFNPLAACEAVGSHTLQEEVRTDLAAVMLSSLGNHPALNPASTAMLCSIFYDMFTDPCLFEDYARHMSLLDVLYAAYQNSARKVASLVEYNDPEFSILDIFPEQWKQQDKPRPDLTSAFSDLTCLLNCTDQQGKQCETSAGNGLASMVCMFLSFRSLLVDLKLCSEVKQPQASLQEWGVAEISPLADEGEFRNQFLEEEVFDLGSVEWILCSLKTLEGKCLRYLVLNDFWLVLAQPDLASPGYGIVKLRWPLWRVQVESFEPKSLQVNLQQGSSVSLEFDDVERCISSRSHCNERRDAARSGMQQKALEFITTCLGNERQVYQHLGV